MERGGVKDFFQVPSKRFLLIFAIFAVLIFAVLASASPILDQLHLNIQTTDSSGNVVTGTFNFVFNISTTSTCSNVVYSKSATLTTDSRGIISYYLNNTGLSYNQQYYLCYYRNGALIQESPIARTPYSFNAQNVTLSGVNVNTNLNLGSYNSTAAYYFGSGKYLTDLNASALNLSKINYWTQNGSALYYEGGNVGIGTSSPFYKLEVNGTVRATNFIGNGSGITGITGSQISNNLNWINATYGNKTYVLQSNTGNLTVNNTNNLGGHPASFFMPLNKSVYGQFDFNGGWQNNGLSIIGGDVYAQQGYFYKINSLQVSTLTVNGSIIPPTGFDNQFDLGNSSLRWRNLYLGNNAYVGGTLAVQGAGNSYFNGNVGIGTSSPSAPLNINASSGAPYYASIIANKNIVLYSASGNSPAINVYSGSIDAQTYYNSADDAMYTQLVGDPTGKIVFRNYASGAALTMLSNGNVGINDNSPAYKLEVLGGVNAYQFYVNGTPITSLASGAIKGSGIANYLPLFNSSDTLTNSAIYQNGSNIGIGTTAPGNQLSVVNSGAFSSVTGYATSIQTYGNTGTGGGSQGGLYVQAGYLTHGNPDIARFSAIGTGYVDLPRMVIKAEGNVGIGTTTPAYKLDVNGSVNAYDFLINGSSITASSIGGVTNTGTANYIPKITSSTSIGNSAIYQSGNNIGIGTISPTSALEISGGNLSLDATGSTVNAPRTIGITGWSSGEAARYNFGDKYNSLQSSFGGRVQLQGFWGVQIAGNTYGHALNFSSGTTSDPSLNVIGTTASAPVLAVTGAASQTGNYLEVRNSAGTPIDVVDSSGNLGLGTTSPSQKLDVQGNYLLNGSTGNLFGNTVEIGASSGDYSGGSIEFAGPSGQNFNITYTRGGQARWKQEFIDQSMSLVNNAGYSVFYANNAGNVGIGTTSPGAKLDVNGNLRLINFQTQNLVRTLPTTVNGEVNVGNFTFTNGGGSLWVSVTVPSSGFSVAKEYLIPIQYGQTKGSWEIVNPISSTGPYSGNDFSLDVNVNNNVASLRLRRTSGSTAGAAYIVIKQEGRNSDTFNSSSATSTVSAPTNIFSGSSITQVNGNVGIGTINPSQKLDVAGNVNAYQFLVNGTPITPGANVSGTGTTNYLAKFTSSGTVGNSAIYQSGNNIGIGTISPGNLLTLYGSSNSAQVLSIMNDNQGTSADARVEVMNGNVYGGLQLLGNQSANVLGANTLNIFNSGNYPIDFSTHGEPRVTITNTGSVGVGTTSPTTNFEVYGNYGTALVKTPSSTGSAVLETQNDLGANAILKTDGSGLSANTLFGVSRANLSSLYSQKGGLAIGTTNAYPLTLGTNGNGVMTIDSSGNVGVGTTSPYNKLEVNGNIGIPVNGMLGYRPDTQHFTYGSSTIATYGLTEATGGFTNLGTHLSGYYGINFYTVNAPRVTIAQNGNVGVGTTSPNERLTVQSPVNNESATTIGLAPSTTTNTQGGLGVVSGGYVSLIGNNVLDFVTAGTNRMRIDSSGNVGIGTTSPGSLLEVDGIGTILNLKNPSSGGVGSQVTGADGSYWRTGIDSSNAYYFSLNGSSNKLYLTQSGNIGIGTTSPAQTLTVSGIGQFQNSGSVQLLLENTGISGEERSYIGNVPGTGALTFRNLVGGNYNFQNAAGNSNLLSINGTTGYVGIGTSSPSAPLDVEDAVLGSSSKIAILGTGYDGNFNIEVSQNKTSNTNGANIGQIGLEYANTENAAIKFYRGGSTTGGYMTFTTNNGAQRMIINANGNVGIGTSSPISRLDISGAQSNLLDIYHSGGVGSVIELRDSQWGAYINQSAGNLYFETGGNSETPLYLSSHGNVGIGTTTPSQKLDVAGTVNAYQFLVNGTPISVSSGTINGSGTANYIPKFTASGTVGNSVIYQSGSNVGIGTTSPSTPLDVNGEIAADGSTSITGSPLSVGTNTGWKIGLYSNGYAIGVAPYTTVVKTGGWLSVFSGNPAGDATSSAPDSNAKVSFGTNGEGLFSGNVGIGTTSPSQKLYVAGGNIAIDNAKQIYFNGQSDTNWRIGRNTGSLTKSLVTSNSIDILSGPSSTEGIAFGPNGGNSVLELAASGNAYFRQNLGVGLTPSTYATVSNSLTYNYLSGAAHLQVGNSASGTYSNTLVLKYTGSANTHSQGILFADGNSMQAAIRAKRLSVSSNYQSALEFYTQSGTDNFSSENSVRMYISPTGNVGIGTTSPSNLLSLEGTTTPATSTTYQLSLTTGGSPYLTAGTDSGHAYLQSWNSKPLILNSQGNNVGIGTTAPSQKLQVNGNIYANNYYVASGNGNGINFWTGNNAYSIKMANTADYEYGPVTDYSIKTSMGGGSGRGFTWGGYGLTPIAALNANSGNFQIAGNLTAAGSGTNFFTGGIQTTGGITINQNNVASATTGNLLLEHPSSGGASSIIFPSTVNRGSDYGYITYNDNYPTYAYWGTSGSEHGALRIGVQNDGQNSNSDVVALESPAAIIANAPSFLVPSGNVGIGTTSPAAKLQVNGSIYNLGSGSQIVSYGSSNLAFYAPSGGIYAAGNVNSYFAGKVGIGTSNSNFKLTAYGGGSSNGINGTSGTGGGYGVYGSNIAGYGVYGYGGTSNTGVYGSGNFGVIGVGGTYGVYSSGDMYTTGCIYYSGAGSPLGTCASDARLKTNVTSLTFKDPLAQINGLRPINYNYNHLFKNGTDKSLHQGLIAQQTLKVAPELVAVNNKTGYYEVKYGDIQWLTLEALQQLSNETTKINTTVTGLVVQQINFKTTINEQSKTISEQNKTITTLNETVTKLSSTLNKICSNNPKLCQ